MTCACGCGQTTLPKRKYVKGHRQLKPMANGYMRSFRPRHALADQYGMVLDHRAVVYDAGIAVPSGHHVHHKNGDEALSHVELSAERSET